MSEEQVLAAAHAGVCCLKLRGELRYPLADAIENYAEQLFSGAWGECRQLVLDLSEARFLDSTVIGLLVGLARELRSRDLPPPTLACSHSEVRELLRHLRLDEVFVLVDDLGGADAGFVPLAGASEEDALRQARMILRAHEALIAANAANREEFAAVVAMFRAEVARLEGDNAAG